MSARAFVPRQVIAGDLRFDVVEAGQGDDAALFLHGFPQCAEVWDPYLRATADAGMRAVAFDQRGYSAGARPPDVDAYALRHLADDVVALADALGIGRFGLVGHDWGGIVGWVLASQAPERLTTLVAVSTPHPAAYVAAVKAGGEQTAKSVYVEFLQQPDEPEKLLLADAAAVLREMYDASGLRDTGDGRVAALVEAYLTRLQEPAAMTSALNWYRAATEEVLAGVGSVAVPVLHVYGHEDSAFGRDAVALTGSHVEGRYDLVEWDGQPHWLPELCFDRLAPLVIDHLARHRTAGT